MPNVSLTEDQVVALVTEFEECFNRSDIDGLMVRMTGDAVFEHVAPPEVSVGRHEGQDAVRALWVSMPDHLPDANIRIDDIFAAGDRCTCRYTLTFRDEGGATVTRRGVDVFRIADGKIAEKLTYLTL